MSGRRYHEAVCADGRERTGVIVLPSRPPRAVAILFHPFGFDAASVIDGEAPGDRLIRPLEGAARMAEALDLALVVPEGRGRALDGVSLAWEGHLDFAWSLAEHAREEYGPLPVVAGGLSQGGLEALVLAGRRSPDVVAVWAANPVVDVAAWHADVKRLSPPALVEAQVLEQIEQELCGTPASEPEAYRARSASSYVSELARCAVQLAWSPLDDVVPHQRERQAGQLAGQLRGAGGSVDERITTHVPSDPGVPPGRYAHESCDVWAGGAFLAAAARTGSG